MTTVKLIAFFTSIAMFLGLVYLICSIWFNGRRNAYLKLFCVTGLLFSFWGLLNGINLLVSEEMYARLYPAVMVAVCILPCTMLRYSLYFTENPHADKRWVAGILIALPTVDTLALLTNSLHYQFISGYDGIRPLTGAYFPIHAVISYVPMLFYIVLLGRYILKNLRKSPKLGYVGAGILLSITFNILYTFGVLDIGFDLTPFTFIIMFALFAVYSIQLRLFDIKTTALAGLFNSLSDLFLLVNNDGVVAGANPAFLTAFPNIKIVLGQTPAVDVVRTIQSISNEYDPPGVFDDLTSDEPKDIQGAEIMVSVNDEWRNYSLARDIILERRQYAGYIITLSDIGIYRRMIDEINAQNAKLTELKDLAESASDAKTIFLANMSHEMRTPMNAIIGMTQIAMHTGEPAQVAQCLGKIDGASKHLLSVINDILDMSKIESATFEIYEKPFVLSRMIDTVVDINAIHINEKKQKLQIYIDERIPERLISDELRLSQVISNLLSNAAKFSPEEEVIDLSIKLLAQDAGMVQMGFSVKDNGIGISTEQQLGLFRAFMQADSGISRKFGGTGLGLAISQKIVELMGGRIQVQSAPGQGSLFTFDITVQYVEEAHGGAGNVAEETPPEADIYDFTGYTILLVEDIEINREIIIELMGAAGVVIDSAENGQDAVDMVTAEPDRYDLIFMDIHMPVLDGYEATRRIRAFSHLRASVIPIIAMTANAFAEDVEKAKNAGMNDHIAKPIDINELLEKTAQYIYWERA